MRAASGWRDVRAVLGALVDSEKRLVILLPETGAGDLRAVKLEEHLRRIAAEVQASGILEITPAPLGLVSTIGQAGLTARQWDVLTRLLRGEQVPTIAQELHLSQSTVRNHLSTIYKRTGVRSQAGLMALAAGGGSG